MMHCGASNARCGITQSRKCQNSIYLPYHPSNPQNSIATHNMWRNRSGCSGVNGWNWKSWVSVCGWYWSMRCHVCRHCGCGWICVWILICGGSVILKSDIRVKSGNDIDVDTKDGASTWWLSGRPWTSISTPGACPSPTWMGAGPGSSAAMGPGPRVPALQMILQWKWQ